MPCFPRVLRDIELVPKKKRGGRILKHYILKKEICILDGILMVDRFQSLFIYVFS